MKLASQHFPPDENDTQDYTWREEKLKPGFRRPVIVHRAILGSVERFTAVLTEHLAGKWPFWLSPRQVIVCPISEKAFDYCESIYLYLHKMGFMAELDRSQGNIKKKIRNAQLEQWNYILVAGEEEMKDGTVNLRTREMKILGKKRIDEVVQILKAEEPAPSTKHAEFYKKAFDPAAFYQDGPAAAGGSSNKAAAVMGAPKDIADRNFSNRLDEIEQTLAGSGQ